MSDKQIQLHNRKSVYLAGPEVFLKNAIEIGALKKEICARHDLEGIFPIDAEIDISELPRRAAGLQISQLNEQLIRNCDAVIANLTPFRGISADVGTVFEIGLARGLGLVVFGYTNTASPFTARTKTALQGQLQRDPAGHLRDKNGMAVEEWDLADNLMLEGGIIASGGSLIAVNANEEAVFVEMAGFMQCVVGVRHWFDTVSEDSRRRS